MLLELAKTGTFNDIKLTKKDLADIAASFSDDVQVVVGHESAIWRDDQPAIGWVKSVDPVKNTLVGDVQFNENGQHLWDSGAFRKWSMGLTKKIADGPWILDHLAVLGARSPAIRGLRVLELSEGSSVIRAEFHNSIKENDIMEIKEMEDKIRAEFAVKEAADKADFAAREAAKDAEIATLKADAATARRAEFSARVEATFKACEGKAPVEKLNDLKAMFSKDAPTIQDVLEGVNALFSSMPPMVSGRIVGTPVDGKAVSFNDLKELA